MKLIKSFLLPLSFLLVISACGKNPNPNPGGDDTPGETLEGLVVNEVSPSKTLGDEGWIELYNSTDKKINLKGMKLYFTNNIDNEPKLALTLTEGSIDAKSWYVLNSTQVTFAVDILLATFEEVSIRNYKDVEVNSFNLTYDFTGSQKPEVGGSYARIPDGTGEWTITKQASPGESNYKITPINITDIIINEVCPSEKWVEIVNNTLKIQRMEYSYLATGSGEKIYVGPVKSELKPNERLVIDTGDYPLDELVYCTNGDVELSKFSSKNLSPSPAGTSWSRLPDITGAWALSNVTTKGLPNRNESTDVSGIVLNEVSAPEKWVEIYNTTVTDIKVNSLMIYGINTGGSETSSAVAVVNETTLGADKGMVVSLDVKSYIGLVLRSSTGVEIDRLMYNTVDDGGTTEAGTCWSRLPNGSGRWYTVKTPTPAERNHGIAKGNKKAAWVFSRDMSEGTLDLLCDAGIGHILLNEAGLESGQYEAFKTFQQQAEARGQKVHVWIQCFYHGGNWIRPVIVTEWEDPDTQKKPKKVEYNQPEYDKVIARALKYLDAKPYGIHFDYIRFGGTGKTYQVGGMTAYMPINEFCKQICTAIKSKKPDTVLSAAVMGETGASAAYGQDSRALSEWLDIIMPMSYISSYGYSYKKNAEVANWFRSYTPKAPNVPSAEIWHGFASYDAYSKGLTAEKLFQDVDYINQNSNVDGMALFRVGLGKFPDFNGMFEQRQTVPNP